MASENNTSPRRTPQRQPQSISSTMIISNLIARFVTILCFSWSLSFVVFGGSTQGKEWFGNFCRKLFYDDKGAIPVVTLMIPILLAGSICSLLLLRTPETGTASRRSRGAAALPHQLPPSFHRCFHCIIRKCWLHGETNFKSAAVVFILAPSIIYVLSSSYRKIHGSEKNLNQDYQMMYVSNAFGLAALLGLSFFLIPVSRHSSILTLFGWIPARAVSLHIWAGRILILASVVHGLMHMFRWRVFANERIIKMIVPPAQCWTFKTDNDFQPTCNDEETDCSCYDHFRNLTGTLAVLAFGLILFTSLGTVRRRFYSFFYKVHVVAGPLSLAMVILHWNRSILYLGGGLLYYIASSFPIIFNLRMCCNTGNCGKGVKILSAELINAQGESSTETNQDENHNFSTDPAILKSQRSCISLTIEVSDIAMQRYRAGQYVKLVAPDISLIAHPFSINAIPRKTNQLRIIFRATGAFTSRLAGRLIDSFQNTDQLPPLVHMDGFYGANDRLTCALRHDVVLLVAGGIGVTAFLSLFEKLQSNPSIEGGKFLNEKVILHWICRDPGLIDYVKRKHLWPLLESSATSNKTSCRTHFTIHQTCSSELETARFCNNNMVNPHTDCGAQFQHNGASATAKYPEVLSSEPFSPSVYTPGSKSRMQRNLPAFVSFSVVAWMGLAGIWILYINVQEKHETFPRIWAILYIVFLGIAASVLCNHFFGSYWSDYDPPDIGEWSLIEPSPNDCNNVELHEMKNESSLEKTNNNTSFQETVHLPAKPVSESDVLETLASRNFIVEERSGRPVLEDLLNDFDGAKQPGLFACGPASLLQDIRKICIGGGSMRFQKCFRGQAKPPIAFYTESFQI